MQTKRHNWDKQRVSLANGVSCVRLGDPCLLCVAHTRSTYISYWTFLFRQRSFDPRESRVYAYRMLRDCLFRSRMRSTNRQTQTVALVLSFAFAHLNCILSRVAAAAAWTTWKRGIVLWTWDRYRSHLNAFLVFCCMSRARFGQCFLVLCEKREIERDAQMLMCQLFLCYRNHSICSQNLGRNLHLL